MTFDALVRLSVRVHDAMYYVTLSTGDLVVYIHGWH